MNLRRKATVVFGAVATAGTIAAAAAFACTNLATLNLSSAAGKAGDSVTVTGSSFNVAKDAASSTPVVLHWNGVDGAVLATASPDKAGNVSATFAVPDGQPGYYVIVATQRDAQGVDKYGTPARASFQILGPNGASVVQAAGPSTAAGVSSNGSSSGVIALTVGLGALGLALFGAGFIAFVRQARGREVPATAEVRK
jgi:hypothetical protein